jgi:hypothetical protein
MGISLYCIALVVCATGSAAPLTKVVGPTPLSKAAQSDEIIKAFQEIGNAYDEDVDARGPVHLFGLEKASPASPLQITEYELQRRVPTRNVQAKSVVFQTGWADAKSVNDVKKHRIDAPRPDVPRGGLSRALGVHPYITIRRGSPKPLVRYPKQTDVDLVNGPTHYKHLFRQRDHVISHSEEHPEFDYILPLGVKQESIFQPTAIPVESASSGSSSSSSSDSQEWVKPADMNSVSMSPELHILPVATPKLTSERAAAAAHAAKRAFEDAVAAGSSAAAADAAARAAGLSVHASQLVDGS